MLKNWKKFLLGLCTVVAAGLSANPSNDDVQKEQNDVSSEVAQNDSPASDEGKAADTSCSTCNG